MFPWAKEIWVKRNKKEKEQLSHIHSNAVMHRL